MDFVDRVLDYLESNLNLYTYFSVDVLGDDDNALMIRRVPSTPSTRFLDGSKDDTFLFQILVRHIKQSTAIQTINEIAIALEELEDLPSLDGSYDFIKCETYTNPTLAEKTDRNCFMYTALFQAVLFIE